MAGVSHEARRLIQRSVSKRLTSWSTTAFPNNPNCAMYGRDIPDARLPKRTEPATDGIHCYRLQVGGPFGTRGLAETLAPSKSRELTALVPHVTLTGTVRRRLSR